ncbi:MAG: hypothetical protein R2720_11900 [Candidatus Nanopelagicales bacterium]
MTHVQPSGAGHNSSARIRILGCEAPPPPKRNFNRRILAACAGAAVLGVGITLAGRALYPQNVAAPPAQPPSTVKIDLMGQASGGARLTNAHTYSVMVSATKTNMSAAARYARAQTRTADTDTRTSPVDPGTAPAPVSAVNPVSTPSTSGTVQKQTASTSTSPIGPEAPQDPTNPNSQIDAS